MKFLNNYVITNQTSYVYDETWVDFVEFLAPNFFKMGISVDYLVVFFK